MKVFKAINKHYCLWIINIFYVDPKVSVNLLCVSMYVFSVKVQLGDEFVFSLNTHHTPVCFLFVCLYTALSGLSLSTFFKELFFFHSLFLSFFLSLSSLFSSLSLSLPLSLATRRLPLRFRRFLYLYNALCFTLWLLADCA